MTEPWDSFLPNAAAQLTATTAIAVAVGWWFRRVVRWWRRMREWREAVISQRFAELLDEQLAPRFQLLNDRVGSVERAMQRHLDEAERRRDMEAAAAEERAELFAALRAHMAREDERDQGGRT